jgi:hypothetical protein
MRAIILNIAESTAKDPKEPGKEGKLPNTETRTSKQDEKKRRGKKMAIIV